jgi:hypothetical protein
MVDQLLIELQRISAQAGRLRDANETRVLLVDLMLLRARLMAARDQQGRAIADVQRGVAAVNAYSHAHRRRT